MKVKLHSIADLKLDPQNVRDHPTKNLDAIKASLSRWGQQKPIVIDGNGVVRAGNGLLMAARALGWTQIAAVQTDLKDHELTAYAIADNRTCDLSTWAADVEKFIADLKIDLPDLDAMALGFDDIKTISESFGQVPEVAPPELGSGDRAPFRQATFTLHDDQWMEVEAALAKAKKDGGGESEVNENSNGNALAYICERFNHG